MTEQERDPSTWPTPEEFVAEWEQRPQEVRLQLAARIIADSQAVAYAVRQGPELVSLRAQVERLWKALGVAIREDNARTDREDYAAWLASPQYHGTMPRVRRSAFLAGFAAARAWPILDATHAPDSAAAKVARVEAGAWQAPFQCPACGKPLEATVYVTTNIKEGATCRPGVAALSVAHECEGAPTGAGETGGGS